MHQRSCTGQTIVKETTAFHESFNKALPRKVTLLHREKCVLSLEKYQELSVQEMKENVLDHVCRNRC